MDAVANTKVEQEVERHVLSVTVSLTDGTKGHIFSRNPNRNEAKQFLYNCHICGVPNLSGERCLYTHLNGRRHQTKVLARVFDAALFRAPLTRTNKIVMQIAPGEPVPPGFENEVKPVAELQRAIDNCKDMSLIGLEYVLELTPNSSADQPTYLCVLCETRDDPDDILLHVSSFVHRSKYLEKHFPTFTREFAAWRNNPSARTTLSAAFQSLCEAIEDKYGRLAPNVCEEGAYEKNRLFYVQEVINDKHIDEKMGSTFLHTIDMNSFKQQLRGAKPATGQQKKTILSTESLERSTTTTRYGRARSRSLDSISSISNTSMDDSPPGKQRARAHNVVVNNVDDGDDDEVVIVASSSSGRANHKRTRSRSPQRPAIPTPSQLSMQANEIGKERYRWEKYRCMVELAVKGLEKSLKEYEKSPETHPLYPEEWKLFWNRRYKELQAEKKDVAKHDFKPEWIIFWTHRMKELHDQAVEKKKSEIRKKLNLPDDSQERTDELKERYAIRAPAIEHSKAKTTSESRGKSSSVKRDDRDHREKNKRSRSRSGSRSRTKRGRHTRSRDRSRDRSRERSHERSRGRSREHSRERRDRSYERERDRRERDRYPRRPPSRGSYNDSDDERAHHLRRPPPPRDEYEADYYVRNHPWPVPIRPPPPHYGGHYPPRPPFHPPHYYPHEHEMSYRRPPHDEGPPEVIEEETEELLTVVSVLRLLTALEDLLGPSLGPKIIDLLAKALALEKVKANSADELLINEDNCVLFETIKEKLKGQLIAEVVEKHQIKAVKRAIKNVAAVIHMVSEREKNKTPEEKQVTEATKVATTDAQPPSNEPVVDKAEIAKKIAAALVAQGKTDATPEQLESLIQVYIEMGKKKRESANAAAPKALVVAEKPQAPATITSTPSVSATLDETPPFEQYQQSHEEAKPTKVHDEEFDLPEDASSALESLTDSDLQTLLQNFKDLSSEEQQHLIAYLKKLESIDPPRVEKLRKYVNLDHVMKASGGSLLGKFGQSNNSTSSTSTKASNAQKATASKSATASKPPFEDDMFYDEKPEPKQKASVIDSDDDDDDYSFDEVFKAASKNVKENEKKRLDTPDEKREPNGRSRIEDANIFDLGDDRSTNKLFDAGDEHSNASSRMSGGDGNVPTTQTFNKTLADTQSIIANLMGSLHKNVQRHYGGAGGDRNQSQSLGSMNDNQVSSNRDDQRNATYQQSAAAVDNRPTIQSNIPFYQQQQMLAESSNNRQPFGGNDSSRGATAASPFIAGQGNYNNAAQEFLQNLLPGLSRSNVGNNLFNNQMSTPMPPMPPFLAQPPSQMRQQPQSQQQQSNILAIVQSQLQQQQQQQQQYPYSTNSQFKRGYY